jgi:hypothetical protein
MGEGSGVRALLNLNDDVCLSYAGQRDSDCRGELDPGALKFVSAGPSKTIDTIDRSRDTTDTSRTAIGSCIRCRSWNTDKDLLLSVRRGPSALSYAEHSRSDCRVDMHRSESSCEARNRHAESTDGIRTEPEQLPQCQRFRQTESASI